MHDWVMPQPAFSSHPQAGLNDYTQHEVSGEYPTCMQDWMIPSISSGHSSGTRGSRSLPRTGTSCSRKAHSVAWPACCCQAAAWGRLGH